MSENLVTVTEQNFEQEVLGSDQPVIVDFWAAWCGPCRMLEPVFAELSGEYAGKIKFAKVNVDEQPSLAARFGVMSIPTLIIFKDGDPTDRIVGLQPKQALQRQLDAYVS